MAAIITMSPDMMSICLPRWVDDSAASTPAAAGLNVKVIVSPDRSRLLATEIIPGSRKNGGFSSDAAAG
jgi:hypothetical protein